MTGNTIRSRREKILARFNKDPDVHVPVCTMGVGGLGCNLQVAKNVFLLDAHWNPPMKRQAVDRIDRLGQDRDMRVVHFTTKDTVEEKVREVQYVKEKTERWVMEKKARKSKPLTVEESLSRFLTKLGSVGTGGGEDPKHRR
ncbi:SNF2 family N-terminal domain-containing protein [Apiospora sp. TS-2023a]